MQDPKASKGSAKVSRCFIFPVEDHTSFSTRTFQILALRHMVYAVYLGFSNIEIIVSSSLYYRKSIFFSKSRLYD